MSILTWKIKRVLHRAKEYTGRINLDPTSFMIISTILALFLWYVRENDLSNTPVGYLALVLGLLYIVKLMSLPE